MVGGDQRLGRRQVVVRRDQHLGLDRVRHAGRIHHRRRERLRGARHHAHQRVVVRAVESALELHDLLALAERTRDPEREERRLRAARGVAHLLGARDGLDDLLGELDRRLVQEEVRRAAGHLPLDRLDDGRMRVAEQHRAGAQEVVEVPSPGHVVHVRAPALLDDELEPGTTSVTAQETSGKDLIGATQKIVLIAHR